MDEGSVHIVGLEARNRKDPALVHDDGIALGVAVAGGIADDLRVEFLEGLIPGYGAGHYIRAGSLAIQVHDVCGDGALDAMGHQPFPDDKAGSGGRLFGAVTTKEVSEALLAQHEININKSKLVQDEPIKSFGTYQLKAKLGYEISGTVNVVVTEDK